MRKIFKHNPICKKTKCYLCQTERDEIFNKKKHHICDSCVIKLINICRLQQSIDVESETMILRIVPSYLYDFFYAFFKKMFNYQNEHPEERLEFGFNTVVKTAKGEKSQKFRSLYSLP